MKRLRRNGECYPLRHRWYVSSRHITVGLSDLTSKGILYRCHDCPAIKAK